MILLSANFHVTWLKMLQKKSKFQLSNSIEFDLISILQKESRQSIHWARILYKTNVDTFHPQKSKIRCLRYFGLRLVSGSAVGNKDNSGANLFPKYIKS